LDNRPGSRPRGQRLVPLARQEQAGPRVAAGAPLRGMAEAGSELGGVLLQRYRREWAGNAGGKQGTSCPSCSCSPRL
jgi:hypothetical protein